MISRNLALGLATFAGGVAALTAAAFTLGRRATDGAGEPRPQQQPLRADPADGPAPSYEQTRGQSGAGEEGHAAPDLTADAVPGDRAPPAFRPDMDAAMTPAEREALRPATGPSPTLIDAGTSMPAGA